MSPAHGSRRRAALLAGLLLAAATLLAAALNPARADAVACPSAIPVINENECQGPGDSGYQMRNFSENVAGFATRTSFALGEDVPLKIARNQPLFPASHVDVAVYRTGDYSGKGARLIAAASRSGVTVNNDFTCNPMDATTGLLSCANWNVTYTIPGSALPASGVYVAVLTATDTGEQNQIVFVVRDDASQSRILLVLPTSTYQAYNNWGGKSLYFDKNGGPNTVAGTSRAVKVSFDRPLDRADAGRNRYLGPDSQLVQWLEKQGYDVTYTDDQHVDQDPASLRQHRVVLVSGHSEYWSGNEMAAFKAARDAGVNLASFSGNTSYWKVRYEDGGRTLVCYKTVEGSGYSGTGRVTPNDPGPDGVAGTADDALGRDGIAGTADDNPQYATTTWRDNGAPPGDPNAPAAGRVGPDEPENSLWGNMYVGDHDSMSWGLTVPAGDGGGNFAASRVWRNTGVPTNAGTTIGTNVVGWEWDQVPTQAQYLSRQPSGVKQVSLTAIDSTTASWLYDEGRARAATPPPGQPASVSAVQYRASSGALVFAAGTNQWALGLGDPRLAQATYNILSDMSVQPATPSGVVLDPQGSNQPPIAAFTAPGNPLPLNQPVTFDASSSRDPDGSITHYEWDLDGDGTFETDGGTSPTLTHTFGAEGSFDIHLRVTDNGGATDFTTRSVSVIGNRPPVAALAASPNPAVTGQDVTLDASASNDPDGSIARYEWDLDGDGIFERDTASTPTVTHSFASVGTQVVGVRVTDDGGKSATTTLPITVNSGGLSNYGDAVLDTAGLMHYWRMGEGGGPTLADSVGTLHANVSGGTWGVAGGPQDDPSTAVSFNGTSDYGNVDLDLTSRKVVTLEFWLKWNSYVNDDHLAMEFTPNFNNQPGGFLVDPDATQFGGTFGVGLGVGTSRNTAFFARPSAGVWHHYAIVLDTTAPGATAITPFVDGQAVPYQKNASGTGATLTASTLYLMSRGGTSLFGNGTLDELAIYNRALDPAKIAEHAGSFGTNRRPVAAFSMSPSPARIGQTVTFDASGSNDPDGTVTEYDWDLDGNGTYETSTGSDPTVTRSYSSEQQVEVGLRVLDDRFGGDTVSHSLFVGNSPPIPKLTASPNPAIKGQRVTIDGSASRDLDGSIARYEWDLDGDGTYETDTGTSPTVGRTFDAIGTFPVGLRVTDNEGKTATATLPITVNSNGVSNYGDTVQATPGLAHYWRMGETTGPTLADSVGTSHATLTGGTPGVPGGPAGDPNTAVRFAGSAGDFARAAMDLSATQKVTVEFWLRWTAYANDDHLAMEFTPNFNNQPGGFLVDPNAPQFGGTFGVGIGTGNGRNNVFFARPSAGVWHHYDLVLDTTAPGATQIVPYVDGKPVSYQKSATGTAGGRFANSSLYLMSRGGASLFGSGDLDEVAVYTGALDADTVADHYGANGTNRRPVSSFTVTPSTARPNTQLTFDGSASHDPDGSIAEYEWDLDGNGTFETDTGTNPIVRQTYASEQTIDVRLRVIDNANGSDTSKRTVTIANQPPVAAFSASPVTKLINQPVTFDASASSDPDGSISLYEWDLDGDGTFETVTGTTRTATQTYSTPRTVNVGLRVTDDGGKRTTLVKPISIKRDTYRNIVTASPGLLDYWRLGEASGTTLADAAGSSPATLSNVTLGAPGALFGDSDTAATFNGTNAYAKATTNYSSQSTLTVEFWLKWNAYASDDRLALELTPNFNNVPGGFIVDPNSGTSFAVSIGIGNSRNTVTFTRPSAGAWHHYAFVLDQAAPAATQITPYVDGQPVTYKKPSSGTATGAFANSTLYFMSRGGTSLFGPGSLDELAIYRGALSASAIADHFAAGTP